MFLLNEFRVSIILRCLGNFDQMRGPIYFIEFFYLPTIYLFIYNLFGNL